MKTKRTSSYGNRLLHVLRVLLLGLLWKFELGYRYMFSTESEIINNDRLLQNPSRKKPFLPKTATSNSTQKTNAHNSSQKSTANNSPQKSTAHNSPHKSATANNSPEKSSLKKPTTKSSQALTKNYQPLRASFLRIADIISPEEEELLRFACAKGFTADADVQKKMRLGGRKGRYASSVENNAWQTKSFDNHLITRTAFTSIWIDSCYALNY